MRLYISLVVFSCLFIGLNTFDIRKIDVNVSIKGTVITVTVPNSPDVASLFFSSELANKCTSSYTFLDHSNDTNLLSYNQDIHTKLKTNDMLRVLGVFAIEGQVQAIAYNFQFDANGNGVLQKLPEDNDVCPSLEPTSEILFEDQFDRSDWGNWSHALYTRHRTDQEFAAFVKNKENSYIKDGKLHIIATASNITKPKYKIKGCTANDVNMCGPFKRYFEHPPLFSATLVNKFKVTRGSKVDIVAQMPIGDWLFPYLLLKPTDDNVEDNYRNNIKIAYVRGNRKLSNTAGNEVGGSYVFGSAYMMDSLETRTEVLHSTKLGPEEHYGERFHTYTVIWLRNRIIFQVDGKTYGTITDNKVFERIKENQKYHIVLGLTAGGDVNFNDLKGAPLQFTHPHPHLLFKESHAIDRWIQPSLVVESVVVSRVHETDF